MRNFRASGADKFLNQIGRALPEFKEEKTNGTDK